MGEVTVRWMKVNPIESSRENASTISMHVGRKATAVPPYPIFPSSSRLMLLLPVSTPFLILFLLFSAILPPPFSLFLSQAFVNFRPIRRLELYKRKKGAFSQLQTFVGIVVRGGKARRRREKESWQRV